MSLTRAGRYEIQGELGRGAMGVVYRGYDPTIGRSVAIKTVLLANAEPDMLKRYRREAQAAGILSHPNIVTIYDAGEDNGVFYIAMELVEGVTLHEILAGAPLPLEEVIGMVEQVGGALDHAHSRDIIHRDIKPANIMVAQGRAKVTDFGVAKISSLGMTSTGQVLGTPSYMSPELIKGGTLDGRSDIFSLGVILYELLTGAKPFTGDNITTVIYKIVGEQPEPPALLNPALDPGLNFVVFRALAKKPEERYQDCAALVADLKNYQARTQEGRRIARATTRVPSPAAAELSDTVSMKKPPAGQARARRKAGLGGTFAGKRLPLFASAGALLLVVAGLVVWNRSPVGPGETAAVEHISMPVSAASGAASDARASGPAPGPGAATATTAPSDAVTGRNPGSQPPVLTRPAAAGSPAIRKATIEIVTDPPSAAVLLDGRQVGETPLRLTLPYGEHRVNIRKTGYVAVNRQIDVNERTPARVSFPLVVLPQEVRRPSGIGRVSIRSQPAGAKVLVDGKETPYRAPVNIQLPAGQHKITLEMRGYQAETREVDIRASRMAQMEVKLTRSGERRGLLDRLPFKN